MSTLELTSPRISFAVGVFSKPENTAAEQAKPEPISMTAPVLIDPTRDTHTMMFLLPASKYKSIEAAPKPSNPNVRLEELPARLMAVRTFSGSAFGRSRSLDSPRLPFSPREFAHSKLLAGGSSSSPQIWVPRVLGPSSTCCLTI